MLTLSAVLHPDRVEQNAVRVEQEFDENSGKNQPQSGLIAADRVEQKKLKSVELKIESIERGNYYHIYNRGNNGADVFFEPENYLHFLRLYEKFLGLISETFAWCLMRNHFHFLMYFKEERELGTSAEIKPGVYKDPSRQLGHLFNSYTQAINRRFNRTGSLFERTFERKKIDSEDYLRKIIYYIHNNPVAHGTVQEIENYPWSSYRTMISASSPNLKKEQVIELFGDLDNFIAFHKRKGLCRLSKTLLGLSKSLMKTAKKSTAVRAGSR